MNANLFSTRLKRRRMEKGLRSKELAEKLSISKPYMSQIEKGLRVPSEELLIKLAAVLGVSKDWLLGLCADSPSSHDPPAKRTEEKTLHFAVGECQECARLRGEVARLNKIIDKLVSK